MLFRSDLLGRVELQQLIEHLTRDTPKLMEDLTPKLLPLSTLHQVLRNLLEESVHIRDMRTIVEVLTAHAVRSQDIEELTAQVRVALGRAITQQLFAGDSEIQVMALDPALEQVLMQAAGSDTAVIEPELANTLVAGVQAAARRHEELGMPVVLVAPGKIRTLLSRFLRRAAPRLRVLSHAEMPDSRAVKIVSIIGEK